MDKSKLHQIRTDYSSEELNSSDLENNPIDQFKLWFEEAINKGVAEPNAFCLSTVSNAGKPSNRIVLVKEIRENGIVFYTNYKSKKGTQISENPHVAACFFWQSISKQVRIEGVCKKISPIDSDTYFNKRPKGSQIGAISSPQSQIISSREWLLEQWKLNEVKNEVNIKRPEFWGGYIIEVSSIEFWQGQPSRLHDRFLYQLNDSQWKIDRLAP